MARDQPGDLLDDRAGARPPHHPGGQFQRRVDQRNPRPAGPQAARSIVYNGLNAFVVGAATRGRRRNRRGAALFVLFAGGVAGTILGGKLATRWGRIRSGRTTCRTGDGSDGW
ncbi:hypothetical protein [Saccharopolyspora spinosa]|uniref:hypothetical protein n=1 Tax=Saccharopolyspora spinosa TaxID=60894 RepID=UPI0002FDE681|nr:hypothetical protein [Saccharopolyspora spinosa]